MSDVNQISDINKNSMILHLPDIQKCFSLFLLSLLSAVFALIFKQMWIVFIARTEIKMFVFVLYQLVFSNLYFMQPTRG